MKGIKEQDFPDDPSSVFPLSHLMKAGFFVSAKEPIWEHYMYSNLFLQHEAAVLDSDIIDFVPTSASVTLAELDKEVLTRSALIASAKAALCQ